MKNYKWNEDEINNYYQKLKSEYKQKKKELDAIKHDLELIKNIDKEPQSNLFLQNYFYNRNFFNKNDYLWKHFQKLETLTNIYSYFDPVLKKDKKSNDELLTISHDFYKEMFTKEYYKLFMSLYNNKQNIIKFAKRKNDSMFHGFTYPFITSNDVFIEVFKKDTIDDIFVLNHEFMHAIAFLMNNNVCNYGKSLYDEIHTIFAELLTKDYINNDEAILANLLNYNSIVYHNQSVNSFINLICYEKTTKKIKNRYQLLKYAELLSLDYDLLKEFFITNAENNSLGYMYAVELYNIYIKDKEKALYILKKIIQTNYSKEINHYKLLEKLGLRPNKHMKSYLDNMDKDILKIEKKQNKTLHL